MKKAFRYGIFLLWLAFVAFSKLSAQAFQNSQNLQADGIQVQNPQNGQINYGIGLKLSAELRTKRIFGSIRASLTFGISQRVVLKFNQADQLDMLPAYHINFDLFRGGIGSSASKALRDRFVLDIANSFMLNVKLDADLSSDPKALYFYHYESPLPLLNPYKNSLSLGTLFIWNSNSKKHHNQQVGYLGASYDRFQFGYYNDGTPTHWWFMGDGYDRWHTGGGFAVFDDYDNDFRFALSFRKYTGFVQEAFDAGTLLGMNFVPYSKTQKEQALYNTGKLEFSALHYPTGLEIGIGSYDHPFTDIQNLIHFSGDMSLHPPALPPTYYMKASYNCSQTNVKDL